MDKKIISFVSRKDTKIRLKKTKQLWNPFLKTLLFDMRYKDERQKQQYTDDICLETNGQKNKNQNSFKNKTNY